MARLLCYVVVLVSGSNWSRHTVLCHLLPYGGRTISIFYQFIQFLEAVVTADGRACCLHLFPSSPYRLSKAPAGQHLYPLLAGPAHSLVRSSTPPCSRGGRPVSAKPIGKQRPKIYFPVSFPSSTNKHSNRSRKHTMRSQFLLTMIYCHLAATSSSAKI